MARSRGEQALRSRRAHEVLADHLAHARRDEIEKDLRRNFDSEVVVLTPQGILRGHDGVRLGHAVVRPSTRSRSSMRAVGRYGQIEWRGRAQDDPLTHVETFIVRNGRVVVHALHDARRDRG